MTADKMNGLLAAIRGGDRGAFEQLYSAMFKPVCSVAYAVLGDFALAEDAAQETFCTIFKKADTYQRNDNPSAWIFTIAHHTALNQLKKQSREAADEDAVETAANGGCPFDAAEDKDALDRLFGTLSVTDRRIVIYHLVAGLKHRETAQLLDLPLSTVLRRYNAALQRMQKKGGDLIEQR